MHVVRLILMNLHRRVDAKANTLGYEIRAKINAEARIAGRITGISEEIEAFQKKLSSTDRRIDGNVHATWVSIGRRRGQIHDERRGGGDARGRT